MNRRGTDRISQVLFQTELLYHGDRLQVVPDATYLEIRLGGQWIEDVSWMGLHSLVNEVYRQGRQGD